MTKRKKKKTILTEWFLQIDYFTEVLFYVWHSAKKLEILKLEERVQHIGLVSQYKMKNVWFDSFGGQRDAIFTNHVQKPIHWQTFKVKVFESSEVELLANMFFTHFLTLNQAITPEFHSSSFPENFFRKLKIS